MEKDIIRFGGNNMDKEGKKKSTSSILKRIQSNIKDEKDDIREYQTGARRFKKSNPIVSRTMTSISKDEMEHKKRLEKLEKHVIEFKRKK